MLNSLDSFDIASEKFMDITNLENFANCYSNHIYHVILLSQVMAATAHVACGMWPVASLAECSVHINFQTIDLKFFYDIFRLL